MAKQRRPTVAVAEVEIKTPKKPSVPVEVPRVQLPTELNTLQQDSFPDHFRPPPIPQPQFDQEKIITEISQQL